MLLTLNSSEACVIFLESLTALSQDVCWFIEGFIVLFATGVIGLLSEKIEKKKDWKWILSLINDVKETEFIQYVLIKKVVQLTS